MREIVFDTETTGVDPDKGDRIVEIGLVELQDLVPTGAVFHRYVNPERDVPPEVVRVHGLTESFLSGFPPFSDPSVHEELLAFIGDAPLVAHNAEFDRKFLNAELARLGIGLIPQSRCVDTLLLARKKYPGAPNSLDALCRRLSIDLSKRDLHGALLDAKLLAAVYLELKGGRERRLAFLEPAATQAKSGEALLEAGAARMSHSQRPRPLPARLKAEEIEAHAAFVATLGKASVWSRILAETAEPDASAA